MLPKFVIRVTLAASGFRLSHVAVVTSPVCTAITIYEPGGPEVHDLAEVPDPAPGPGEVLIDVAATAVNRADLLQRRGYLPAAARRERHPRAGMLRRDRRGRRRRDGWRSATRSARCSPAAATPSGSPSPPPSCCRCPTGVDLRAAAALPEVACTVWSNLVMDCGLHAGQVLLVHGGGGGHRHPRDPGGQALGARVAVTAGSPSKLERCRELGADSCQLPRRGLRRQVRAATPAAAGQT